MEATSSRGITGFISFSNLKKSNISFSSSATINFLSLNPRSVSIHKKNCFLYVSCLITLVLSFPFLYWFLNPPLVWSFPALNRTLHSTTVLTPLLVRLNITSSFSCSAMVWSPWTHIVHTSSFLSWWFHTFPEHVHESNSDFSFAIIACDVIRKKIKPNIICL